MAYFMIVGPENCRLVSVPVLLAYWDLCKEIKILKVASNTTADYVIVYIQNDVIMFENVM